MGLEHFVRTASRVPRARIEFTALLHAQSGARLRTSCALSLSVGDTRYTRRRSGSARDIDDRPSGRSPAELRGCPTALICSRSRCCPPGSGVQWLASCGPANHQAASSTPSAPRAFGAGPAPLVRPTLARCARVPTERSCARLPPVSSPSHF